MIPEIGIGNIGIGNVGIGNVGVSDLYVDQPNVRSVLYIAESNLDWMVNPPSAIPPSVPVTVEIGNPIVNMPGCVEVHKENARKDPSKSKNLVNDDPKGTTTLCDSGMPSYYPADYDARELFWQTINTEPEDGDQGVDTQEQEPIEAPSPPPPPPTDGQIPKEVECPPKNARRIGDRNQKGDEQVKEYKLTPDGKICETIWEPVPIIDQYLPSVGVVTTTATIATVATASALFAKPLADLILKVVKPVVKKTIAKVQKILGKKPYRPTSSEIQTNRYREKKGLPPLKKKG